MDGALLVHAPAATAEHVYSEVDKDVTLIVTEDGDPPTGLEVPNDAVFMGGEGYTDRYEHDKPTSSSGSIEEYLLPFGKDEEHSQGPSIEGHNSLPYAEYTDTYGWHISATWTYPDVDKHRPPNGCNWSDTSQALDRFEDEFSVTMAKVCYHASSCWDPSNVADGDAAAPREDLRENVYENCSYWRDSPGEVVFGWVDNADHNGIAYGDGHFGIGAEATDGGVDWRHDQIVQHEFSHFFNAPDRGTWCWGGDGIMNYCEAYGGATHWAQDDWNIVINNIWKCACGGPH